MMLKKIKNTLRTCWFKFLESWAEAHEIQTRIDEARLENIRRYGCHWKI